MYCVEILSHSFLLLFSSQNSTALLSPSVVCIYFVILFSIQGRTKGPWQLCELLLCSFVEGICSPVSLKTLAENLCANRISRIAVGSDGAVHRGKCVEDGFLCFANILLPSFIACPSNSLIPSCLNSWFIDSQRFVYCSSSSGDRLSAKKRKIASKLKLIPRWRWETA